MTSPPLHRSAPRAGRQGEETHPSSVPLRVGDLADLYRRVIPATVQVRDSEGAGSGVVLDQRGLVATCRHVVEKRGPVVVRQLGAAELPARVVRSWRPTDLAILQLPEGTYEALELASEGELQIGQEVVAVGHPRGLANTLSRGVISGLGRMMQGARFLQSDAATHPGSSGGPLVDARCRVVGLSSQCRGSPLLSLSIPVDVVAAGLAEVQARFDELAESPYCELCGELGRPGETWCRACGTTLQPPKPLTVGPIEPDPLGAARIDRCAVCAEEVGEGTLYCTRCGASLLAPPSSGEPG